MENLIESVQELIRHEVNDVHGINLDEVDYSLQRVLGLVAGGTACKWAWLSMVVGDRLVPVAAHGCASELRERSSSPEWAVIDSGEPIRVHDLDDLDDNGNSLFSVQTRDVCSAAIYPVFSGHQEKTIGVLAVAHDRPRTFPRMQQRVIHDGVRVIEDMLALRRDSIRDPLTGCFNRRHFDRQLVNEWRRANRNHLPLSYAIIDVDHFKPFNDTAGHSEGDQVLRRIGGALSARTRRAGDLVCRYGGEEFSVILPNTPGDAAVMLMDEFRRAVQEMGIPHPAFDSSPVTISVGVSSASSFEDVMNNDTQFYMNEADQALYRAKQAGRNRVVAAWSEAPAVQTMTGSS